LQKTTDTVVYHSMRKLAYYKIQVTFTNNLNGTVPACNYN